MNLFRYRERFHLSYRQVLQEPAEEFGRATLIWSLDAARAKLETERASK
jgi:hypothetical protein